MQTPNLLPAWKDCTPAKAATAAVALRSLRRREGLSREALARVSRIKPGRIADMENGKRSIPPKAGKVLAVIFNTSPLVFLPL